MHLNLIILFCIQIVLTISVHAFDNTSVNTLIDSISVLNDADEKRTIEDVSTEILTSNFKKLEQNNSFEAGRGAITKWLKLDLSKKINPSKNYILELDRPTLDDVTVFIPKENNKWKIVKTGDNLKFNTRDINHENFIFSISGSEYSENPNYIYLRVKDKIISSVSIFLWEETEYNHYDKSQNLLKGLYFGALLALILFNLFIYLSVKDISYLWYVGYLGFITFFFLAYTGLAFRYFWPEFPVWADKATLFGLFLSMAMGLMFCRSILNIKLISARLSSVLLFTATTIVSLLLIGLLIEGSFLSDITPLIAFLMITITAYSIFKSATFGYKPAYFVALSYSFIFLGGGMFALYKLGVVPENILSKYGFQLGVLIEGFLLSFALAYRINYINDELKISNQKIIDSKKLFSSKLIEMQDNERKNIAANLHDSLGQKLMVIKIQLAQLFESFNVSEDDSSVKSTVGLLKESINDVRDISHHLHPHQLERLTLKEALEDVISQSFKNTTIDATYDFEVLESCNNKKIQLHIYRIIQGSIKNILAHSSAKNVEFMTRNQENSVELVIRDDGIGIHSDWFHKGDFSDSFGLSSIRERVYSINGLVDFVSDNGTGFQIIINLPCDNSGEIS